ncbi:MAG: D-glycero-beta-D-manno-heptose 1,7-bisphosphate 7-phosphatase [Clostridia bacterium]|nr:D-glycero-beta-D-manno-heptose 1,7-bisphosphate 7-phosphatase [Clostridia bacterium]
MNKAVFLDRDGTINIDKAYLSKVEDFKHIPGAIEGLKMLQDAGYLLIVITNQSGIARGYYSEEDFLKLNNWMLSDLKKKGIKIAKVYYCPHHPNGKIEKYKMDCNCRKPKLGMYEEAIEDFDIDLSQSFAIGDKIRDVAICEKTSCRGYLISNLEKSEVIEDVKKSLYHNVRYSADLNEAAKEIVYFIGGK